MALRYFLLMGPLMDSSKLSRKSLTRSPVIRMEGGFKRKRKKVIGRCQQSGFETNFIQIDTFHKQVSIKTLMEEIQPLIIPKTKIGYSRKSLLIAQLGNFGQARCQIKDFKIWFFSWKNLQSTKLAVVKLMAEVKPVNRTNHASDFQEMAVILEFFV